MTDMSPYLLLGFLAAGALSVWVSPAFVERHLGRAGFPQILKAALLGVPLPLCSCSVIPVAASLRRHGASKGATVSFLASTPQTGVDSIFATWALLGPVFTLFRVMAAFITGLVAGFFTEGLDRDARPAGSALEACPHCRSRQGPAWRRMLRYGLLTLPKDIAPALLIGVLVSGVLTAVAPKDFFVGRLPPGIPSMLLMMAFGIPIYVCSTGSIPIAYALLGMGVSPGAVLVFLIAGPATNAATVSTIWSVLGRRVLVAYLAAIVLCGLGAGMLMNLWAPEMGAVLHHAGHGWMPPAWFGAACAVALLGLLFNGLRARRG